MTDTNNSPYRFELQQLDHCIVAAFGGEISSQRYSEFRNDYNEICRTLTASDHKCLVLDLTETTFFGSLFIGMVVKLALMLNTQQGRLVLCGLSDQLKQLMKQLLLLERDPGTQLRLRHVPTRADAIAVLQNSQPDA